MQRRLGDPAQSLEQILRAIERDPRLMKRVRAAAQTPGSDRMLNRWKHYLSRRGVNTDELLARILREQS